ncbi:MAG: hypothetical protein ACRDNK_20380 [Solirubrobacteraceae bacterium]
MTPRVALRRRRLAIRLTGGALAWSVGLVVSALLVPVYDGQTVVDANGITLTTATYVQRNGAWILIPILLPALASVASALAIARPHRRAARWAWLPVGLVWAVGLVTVTNAGGLLLPVAVLASLGLRLVLPRGDGGDGGDGDDRPDRGTAGREPRRRPDWA